MKIIKELIERKKRIINQIGKLENELQEIKNLIESSQDASVMSYMHKYLTFGYTNLTYYLYVTECNKTASNEWMVSGVGAIIEDTGGLRLNTDPEGPLLTISLHYLETNPVNILTKKEFCDEVKLFTSAHLSTIDLYGTD